MTRPPTLTEVVNSDGVLNSFDLILIANAFGNTIVLPSLRPEALTMLISTDVEGWLT